MNKIFIHSIMALAITGALVTGTVISANAAAPAPTPPPMENNYDDFTPEKQAKYDSIMKSFYDKVAPITEKMMAKRLELNALSGNNNADPKRIATLSEELAAMQTQMYKERTALSDTLSKELGIRADYGRGKGQWHGYAGKHNGDRMQNRGGMHNGGGMHGAKGKPWHSGNHNGDGHKQADCPGLTGGNCNYYNQ